MKCPRSGGQRSTPLGRQAPMIIWADSDYLVENGKIKSSFTFYNEADAIRQLGYKIVPADQQ